MPASPSHDERGDAASAAAALDINALDSFTESGGWAMQYDAQNRPYYTNTVTGQVQWQLPTQPALVLPPPVNSLLPPGWKEEIDPSGRVFWRNLATQQTTSVRPLAKSKWDFRFDSKSGRAFFVDHERHTTSCEPPAGHEAASYEPVLPAAAPDIKALDSFTESGGGNSQAAGEDRPSKSSQKGADVSSVVVPVFDDNDSSPEGIVVERSCLEETLLRADREQQQQQPQPKQQHLPLATGESEEGSVDYDSEDSIRVISIQLGYPAGQQEQQGRKGKNATQSSVAVKGQSNVGQIKSSFCWAFAKGNKEIKSHSDNRIRDHRQESLIQSFQRRFPNLSQYFLGHCPSSSRHFEPVVYPAARYQVHHFSIRVFFVQTPELRNQCLHFCRQSRSLSIDTETAPLNSKIDLLQIGDENQVYLCPLRDQDPGFLNAVAKAIFQDACKTVFQFGSDDATKFLRAIDNRTRIASSLVDVQDRLRIKAGLPQGRPPNLVDAVRQSRYGGDGYILSKAWTISGWDNIPLHPDQAEYAALDAYFAFLLGSDTN
jgi:hypothetical protein